MNILIINAGSSSLKWKVISMPQEITRSAGVISEIGRKGCFLKQEGVERNLSCKNHSDALREVLENLNDVPIEAAGYRVVHGGAKYKEAAIINSRVISDIDSLSGLAPVHNPLAIQCISSSKKLFSGIPLVAVFDTAFHQTISQESYRYAIPEKWFKNYGVRKYGFHGISHKYVMEQTQRLLGKSSLNIISCHLGNGSSICAIKENKSIETSMGLTPLQGLVMGQRSGDIDPSVIQYIMKKERCSVDKVISILNKESGLLGLSSESDFKRIHELAEKGDAKSKRALAVYEHRLLFYIGGYRTLLGGLDALAFTGGVGEGAYYLRESICNALGISTKDTSDNPSQEWIISHNNFPAVLVINANEELMIAREAFQKLR